MRQLLRVTLLLLPALAGACSNTAPENEGVSGRRMEPTSDSWSEVDNGSLRSKDLIAATDRMAMDLAARLDVTNSANPPVIYVGEIQNHTAEPDHNWQIFLTRMRAELNASGARHGLRFVRERQYIEAERDREYGNGASSPPAYTSDADYVLTCDVRDLPGAKTNFFFLDYQLVQLRDAVSGPNLGKGRIVWENQYEVKFQP